MIDPPPCVPHVPRGVPRAGHHGPHIDRHDLLEVREVVIEEAAVHRAGHPGVVDHHVQAAEALDRRRHQAADLVEFGHVGLDEVGIGADVLGQRRTGVAIDVADQHLGAFGGEPSRQTFAQPRRATGDDRDLARQFIARLANRPFSYSPR